MKRIVMFVFAIGMIIMCGCGSDPAVAGDELIKKARMDYTNLNSAKVIITNTETDEAEQIFEFKYDEKGFLTFAYEGINGDEVYAQYNNGAESYTYENGTLEHMQKGDKDFSVYTKDVTHPQADEGLIVFVPKSVSEAKVTEENGMVCVHHEYDVEKLGNNDVTGFSVDYYFDSNKKLLYFVEISEMDSQVHSYKVEITEQNSVGKIENPVEKYMN